MSRVKPSGITGPAYATTERWRKWGIQIAKALLAIVAVLLVYNWATRLSSVSRQEIAAGGNEIVAPPPSNRVTLGLVPVDLTEGGTLGITWNLVVPGQCIKVYDNKMHYLGKDCEDGPYLDLTQRTPTFFAAANSEEVDITYDTWRP